jgi:SAM-dependent methyltransferase
MILKLKSFLQKPEIYLLFKKLIISDTNRKLFVSKHIKAQKGDSLLDIGCGPADILDLLPEVNYVGFDINPLYIEYAKRKYDRKGKFFCQHVSSKNIIKTDCFDIILAYGVLHHLNNEESLKLFHLAKSAMKPSGKLITFDGCYTENQPPIKKYILSKDRGEFVRTQNEYVSLASNYFPVVNVTVYEKFLRIPYSHIVMECKI